MLGLGLGLGLCFGLGFPKEEPAICNWIPELSISALREALLSNSAAHFTDCFVPFPALGLCSFWQYSFTVWNPAYIIVFFPHSFTTADTGFQDTQSFLKAGKKQG